MDLTGIIQPIGGLIVWLILALVRKPLARGLTNVDKGIGEFFKHLIALVEAGDRGSVGKSPAAHAVNAEVWRVVESIVGKIADALAAAARTLRLHCAGIRDRFGPAAIRPWRIVGATAYMVAGVFFLYADFAQGANSAQGWDETIEVPIILQNLLMPILVASGGSAAMLGLIIGDFLGLSDFAPWNDLKGTKRTAIIRLTVACFVVAVLLSFIFGMTRFYLSTELSKSLDAYLRGAASFAQVAIFAPMLVTTFLIWWRGLAGFLLVWIVIVGSIWLSLAVLQFCLELLMKAMSLGDKGFGIVLTVLLTLLHVFLSVTLASFNLIQTAVRVVLVIMDSGLEVMGWPFARISEYAGRFEVLREKLRIGQGTPPYE